MYQSVYNSSVGNIILAVGGLIPGYYFTMLFIDKWGRKPIQLMGFAILTAIFIVMGEFLVTLPEGLAAHVAGFAYDKLVASNEGKKAFVFLYCMANLFQNFVSALKRKEWLNILNHCSRARAPTPQLSSSPARSSRLDTDRRLTVSLLHPVN